METIALLPLVMTPNSSTKTRGYLPQIGGLAPPTQRDSSGVARTLSRPCYPHTGSGGLNLVFERYPILVGMIVRAMHKKATSNILYITVDNTPLLSKPSVCCPWVVAVVGVV